MKSTVRLFLFAVLLGAGVSVAPAQGIVIDSATVAAMFAVGTTTTYRGDTLTTVASIGDTGLTSWDFSGLNTHTRMSLESVVPGTTEFAADFPTATHALRDTAFTYSFTFTGLGLVILRGTGFNYMRLGTDLLDYGFKGKGNAFINGSPYPAQGAWVKTPSAVYFGLPLGMGKSWTTSFVDVLQGSATLGPLGTIPFGPDTTWHDITYTVDAYGQLTVPISGQSNGLRIRKVDRFATRSAQGVRVGYYIVAENGASVQFGVADTAATSGTVGVYSLQWTTSTLTSVQRINDVPTVLTLRQNYPNPFNPSTTIRFTLPSSQHVTLKVYNLLGEEVATLVDEMIDAGESSVQFDGARLSSGVYLYKLQSGTSTQTRRMMLVK